MMVRMPTWCPFQLEKYLRDATRPAYFTNEARVEARSVHGMTFGPGAKRMMGMPNAGGSSLSSEVMSVEVLRRTLMARLLKTEMEIEYRCENGKITDYTMAVFDKVFGVSVTRAVKFRGKFTFHDAEALLAKKLNGVVWSTRNSVVPFHKQILHVWAYSPAVAKMVRAAYRKMPADLKSNTVVVVTVVENADWIFFEPKLKKY